MAAAVAASTALHLMLLAMPLNNVFGAKNSLPLSENPSLADRLDATLVPRPEIAAPAITDPSRASGTLAQLESVTALLSPVAARSASESTLVVHPGESRRATGALLADYFGVGQLDVKPQIRIAPVLMYPDSEPTGITTAVTITVLVSPTGEVDAVLIKQSSGKFAFDLAAQTAFLAARYHPGQIGGRTVPASLDVEVWFGRSPRATPTLESPRPVPSAAETPPTPPPRPGRPPKRRQAHADAPARH
jgi:TonB family protein